MTILDEPESKVLSLIYKFWLLSILPAVFLALYLLYMVQAPVGFPGLSAGTSDKSSTENGSPKQKEDFTPGKIENLKQQ